jgi:hypothetical protein
MTGPAAYGVQFFRQWVGDVEIVDEAAGDSIDEAKAVAKARLAAHAATLKGREAPRVARVFERETHEILAEFRMTADGPLERAK